MSRPSPPKDDKNNNNNNETPNKKKKEMEESHRVISMYAPNYKGKKWSSLPLLLPSNVTYDSTNNTCTAPDDDDEDNENDENNNNNNKSKKLVLVPNAGWDLLQDFSKTSKDTMSVISCVGPYRTGKSYLMSRFLQQNDIFEIGPTLEGCTRGIWISTMMLQDLKTNNLTFLLDVEGLGDPLNGSDDEGNARMALCCLLLSNVFVFNNTSHPDRRSLQFLQVLDTIQKRIPSQQHRQLTFPHLVWVFRDFFLQLPYRKKTANKDHNDKDNKEEPPERYTLQEYMMERVLNVGGSDKNNNSNPTTTTTTTPEGRIVDSLLKDFGKSHKLHVLPVCHPTKTGQQPLNGQDLAELHKMDWNELDETFQKDIQTVIDTCLNLADTTPFQLGDRTTTKSPHHHHGGGGADATMDDAPTHPSSPRWMTWAFGKNEKQQKQQQPLATMASYTKWCQTVVELVNSNDTIPNLPDLQHQLLQTLAQEQLSLFQQTFQMELETLYWNHLPVYNNNNNNNNHNSSNQQPKGKKNKKKKNQEDNNKKTTAEATCSTTTAMYQELIDKYKLKPIAEESELVAQAQTIMDRLQHELCARNIISGTILHDTLTELERECIGIKGGDDDTTTTATSSSILARIQEENVKRSHAACVALANHWYTPLQSQIRTDPTSMSVQELESKVSQWKTSFEHVCRGPAKATTLQSHLLQPATVDKLWMAKVTFVNHELQESLQVQKTLSKDVKTKQAQLQTMEQNLQKLEQQTKERMEELQMEHERAMHQAIREQQERERQQLAKLQQDMEAKLQMAHEKAQQERQRRQEELELFQKQAQQRLESEVQTRENKWKQEQALYEKQLKDLEMSASEELQVTLQKAEEHRRQEQAKMQQEMSKQLQETEFQYKLELAQRQAELLEIQRQAEKKERENENLQNIIDEQSKKFVCANCCIM